MCYRARMARSHWQPVQSKVHLATEVLRRRRRRGRRRSRGGGSSSSTGSERRCGGRHGGNPQLCVRRPRRGHPPRGAAAPGDAGRLAQRPPRLPGRLCAHLCAAHGPALKQSGGALTRGGGTLRRGGGAFRRGGGALRRGGGALRRGGGLGGVSRVRRKRDEWRGSSMSETQWKGRQNLADLVLPPATSMYDVAVYIQKRVSSFLQQKGWTGATRLYKFGRSLLLCLGVLVPTVTVGRAVPSSMRTWQTRPRGPRRGQP